MLSDKALSVARIVKLEGDGRRGDGRAVAVDRWGGGRVTAYALGDSLHLFGGQGRVALRRVDRQ